MQRQQSAVSVKAVLICEPGTNYGFSARLRGLEGDCNIVLMNPEDMQCVKVVNGQEKPASKKLSIDQEHDLEVEQFVDSRRGFTLHDFRARSHPRVD